MDLVSHHSRFRTSNGKYSTDCNLSIACGETMNTRQYVARLEGMWPVGRYFSMNRPIEHECERGHRWKESPRALLQRGHCKMCKLEKTPNVWLYLTVLKRPTSEIWKLHSTRSDPGEVPWKCMYGNGLLAHYNAEEIDSKAQHKIRKFTYGTKPF